MKSEILSRLTKLEGPRPNDPTMILVASGDRFIQKGTNKSFTPEEAADLDARGLATVITFRVVYHEKDVTDGPN